MKRFTELFSGMITQKFPRYLRPNKIDGYKYFSMKVIVSATNACPSIAAVAFDCLKPIRIENNDNLLVCDDQLNACGFFNAANFNRCSFDHYAVTAGKESLSDPFYKHPHPTGVSSDYTSNNQMTWVHESDFKNIVQWIENLRANIANVKGFGEYLYWYVVISPGDFWAQQILKKLQYVLNMENSEVKLVINVLFNYSIFYSNVNAFYQAGLELKHHFQLHVKKSR